MVFGVFEANIFKVNINLAINYLSQTSAHITQISAYLSKRKQCTSAKPPHISPKTFPM